MDLEHLSDGVVLLLHRFSWVDCRLPREWLNKLVEVVPEPFGENVYICENMKDEDVKSAHLPHISLRRWAGIGPRMSTTSPPYLSCSFRLFNSIDMKMMVKKILIMQISLF